MSLLHEVSEEYCRIVTTPNRYHAFCKREKFVRKWAWAVPSKGALDAIAAFVGTDKLLEVGAGSGLWSRLLADRGLKVFATDSKAWAEYTEAEYFHVEPLDAVDAVPEFNPQALMFCWPHFRDSWDEAALAVFKGNKVIYIGEAEGGCTGSPAFHSRLSRDFDLLRIREIPQFQGIHDAVFLYRRRDNPNTF